MICLLLFHVVYVMFRCEWNEIRLYIVQTVQNIIKFVYIFFLRMPLCSTFVRVSCGNTVWFIPNRTATEVSITNLCQLMRLFRPSVSLWQNGFTFDFSLICFYIGRERSGQQKPAHHWPRVAPRPPWPHGVVPVSGPPRQSTVRPHRDPVSGRRLPQLRAVYCVSQLRGQSNGESPWWLLQSLHQSRWPGSVRQPTAVDSTRDWPLQENQLHTVHIRTIWSLGGADT